VKLEVFNVLGDRVATLVDGSLAAGVHTALWNASGAASGVYFYRVTVPGHTLTKKAMLLR
jgi:hypothetical protein